MGTRPGNTWISGFSHTGPGLLVHRTVHGVRTTARENQPRLWEHMPVNPTSSCTIGGPDLWEGRGALQNKSHTAPKLGGFSGCCHGLNCVPQNLYAGG